MKVELYGPVVSSFAIGLMLQSKFCEAGPSAALQTFICFNRLSMCQTINYKDMLLLEKASSDKILKCGGDRFSTGNCRTSIMQKLSSLELLEVSDLCKHVDHDSPTQMPSTIRYGVRRTRVNCDAM